MLTQARLSRAPDDATLLKVIGEGIRGTEMPGADSMSDREMRQTAAYVRSLGKLPQKPVPGKVENKLVVHSTVDEGSHGPRNVLGVNSLR